jgi:DNA modification methylase
LETAVEKRSNTSVESKPDSLVVRRVALAELHPDPANARSHPQANLDAISASLARFGQAEPLVVQKRTGRVVGGNGRLVAMKALGWKEADIVELDIDDLKATALGIALNRTAESAEWNLTALTGLLQQLQAEDALSGVGFEDADIDGLLRQLEKEVAAAESADPGPQEPPEIPVTKLGDLWLLGEHRLLCGDSTQAADVARLMNGEQAQLLCCDAPYLVDYDGQNHPQSYANRPETANKSWDAYKDPTTGLAFFKGWLEACLPHCREDVPVYQWHAHRRQALVEQAWIECGLLVHQQIIWVKSRPVLTRSHFMWSHEPCFYGWPKGSMPDKARKPEPNARSVWEVDQIGSQDGIHPTQKPTELFERPIGWHTRAGEVCLEAFSGSGTQIMAADRLGRRCFAMELAPAYVDAAVLRWQKATGKEARLEGSGCTFAERSGARP